MSSTCSYSRPAPRRRSSSPRCGGALVRARRLSKARGVRSSPAGCRRGRREARCGGQLPARGLGAVGLRSIAASGPDLGEAADGVVGEGHGRATIDELGDDAVLAFTREPREGWTGHPGRIDPSLIAEAAIDSGSACVYGSSHLDFAHRDRRSGVVEAALLRPSATHWCGDARARGFGSTRSAAGALAGRPRSITDKPSGRRARTAPRAAMAA